MKLKQQERWKGKSIMLLWKKRTDKYLDHVFPDNEIARCIAEEIINFLIDSDSQEILKAVLWDNIPVNTGHLRAGD